MGSDNVVVLDLETLRSADACRHCGELYKDHFADGFCENWEGDKPPDRVHQFSAIGWNDKVALGLSIGCCFDYLIGSYTFFDQHTLEATMRVLVERQPLLVSFNGLQFDFPLMCQVLYDIANRQGDRCGVHEPVPSLLELAADFTKLFRTSYDILDQIWRVDPARKFEKGLNSLEAISVANGFGHKALDGALAPVLWAQGRHAEVINYCMADVTKTKLIYERICTGNPIMRGDRRAIKLPMPKEASWTSA